MGAIFHLILISLRESQCSFISVMAVGDIYFFVTNSIGDFLANGGIVQAPDTVYNTAVINDR